MVKDVTMGTNTFDQHRGRGEPWARLWRHVRRGERPTTSETPRCGASGWHLNSGCTDGDGGAVCPLCSRMVRTVRTAGAPSGVEVIQTHCA